VAVGANLALASRTGACRVRRKALERQVQNEIRPRGLASPLEIRRFWIKTAGNARLEAFGTPVEQLLLFGKLDEAQYSATRASARLAARYRLPIELSGGEARSLLTSTAAHRAQFSERGNWTPPVRTTRVRVRQVRLTHARGGIVTVGQTFALIGRPKLVFRLV
jgi:hypothetical protein